jgi:hypothetical protein
MFPTVFQKGNDNVGLKSSRVLVRIFWQVLRVAKVLDHDGLVIVTGTFRLVQRHATVGTTNVACQEVGRHFGHVG